MTSDRKQTYRIALEGGIGAGKSTLIERLAAVRPLWSCHLEPVHSWKNWEGVNYLEKFSIERTRESRLQLDTVIRKSYLNLFLDEPPVEINIYERSPFSAAFVFSKVNQKAGYLHPEDVDRLVELYRTEMEPLYKMDATVYLRTLPDLCLQRRHVRNGETGELFDAGDTVVNSDYEKTVFACNEDIFGPDKTQQPTATLIIDETRGELDVKEKLEVITRYIEEKRFLDGTTHCYGGGGSGHGKKECSRWEVEGWKTRWRASFVTA